MLSAAAELEQPVHRVGSRPVLRLVPTKLPKVVAELTREGWHVEADGKLYRQPGELKVNVRSGIDWLRATAGEVVLKGGFDNAPRRILAHVPGGDDDRAVLVLDRHRPTVDYSRRLVR